MDFLIVGRFRAMSTPSNGGAMCKTIAGLDFAQALAGDSLELAESNANTCCENGSAAERAPRDIS
jgi:hypothetical protein